MGQLRETLHACRWSCACSNLCDAVSSANHCAQTLVKRTKHGDDAMNIDATLASNIAARSRFKETDLDVDAEYDYDAGLEMCVCMPLHTHTHLF